MDKYHYTITQLDAGSAKYGNCEICHSHVDTAYFQIETVEYEVLDPGQDNPHIALTQYGCDSHFGHKQCLLSKRH